MKKERIVTFGTPVLREKAEPVRAFHKKLHAFIDAMKFTLMNTGDAAALAAPQVSVARRITVINYLGEYHEMVNPEILERTGGVVEYEGCLSFPGFSGKVKRFETVKVKFQDRHGREHVIERSGRMARCIQHEVDHLDGVLYIDRMQDEFVINDDKKTKLAVKDLLKLYSAGAGAGGGGGGVS
ncbi:MAG: peptide deformylase [Spirochaetes bacterium]|nr:MAG: peptide deformylase [Spirochaetota bacterium]